MSCDDLPKFIGQQTFKTGFDDNIVSFIFDNESLDIPITGYDACNLEIREDNSLSSPVLASINGVIEPNIRGDEDTPRQSASVIFDETSKANVLGDKKSVRVFAVLSLTNDTDEFPVWHSNFKIVGVL